MLSLQQASFRYDKELILKDISVTIEKGEVHAFLGLNGAGKSTLIQVLAGVLTPAGGTFESEGKVVFVPQEVDAALASNLTVLENFLVSSWKSEKKFLFKKRQFKQEISRFLAEWNVELPLDALIEDCSLYEKQLLLLMRALYSDASYLLFDEPTSALGAEEVETFQHLLKHVKEQGVGVGIILHKLQEVKSMTDVVTVLRDGVVSMQEKTANVTPEEIHAAMVHQKVESAAYKKEQEYDEKDRLYLFENVRLRSNQSPFSLSVFKGETIVIYGANGNGKTSLGKSLFGAGLYPYSLQANQKTGKQRVSTIQKARSYQIAFVPEERRKEGLFLQESVLENVSINFKGLINKKQEYEHAKKMMNDFHITPADPYKKVAELSGGNQQKVCIAKWFLQSPRLLILDEPMKGIDVQAKAHIFQFIQQFKEDGGAILYLTNDIEEAQTVGDRLYTIEKGELREGVTL